MRSRSFWLTSKPILCLYWLTYVCNPVLQDCLQDAEQAGLSSEPVVLLQTLLSEAVTCNSSRGLTMHHCMLTAWHKP